MVFILAVPSCCPTDFKTLDSEARRFWTIAELYCFKKITTIHFYFFIPFKAAFPAHIL